MKCYPDVLVLCRIKSLPIYFDTYFSEATHLLSIQLYRWHQQEQRHTRSPEADCREKRVGNVRIRNQLPDDREEQKKSFEVTRIRHRNAVASLLTYSSSIPSSCSKSDRFLRVSSSHFSIRNFSHFLKRQPGNIFPFYSQ